MTKKYAQRKFLTTKTPDGEKSENGKTSVRQKNHAVKDPTSKNLTSKILSDIKTPLTQVF